jgi:hypothetical protein
VIVSVKYVAIVLRVLDEGEGGTFAVYSLRVAICTSSRDVDRPEWANPKRGRPILFDGIRGGSL